MIQQKSACNPKEIMPATKWSPRMGNLIIRNSVRFTKTDLAQRSLVDIVNEMQETAHKAQGTIVKKSLTETNSATLLC
jgi:hypothetical protein